MKVLLGVPPACAGSRTDMPIMMPLALYTLTGLLRARGHEVRVLDPRLHSDLMVKPERLADLAADVDLVGLSCNSFNWAVAYKVIKELHRLTPRVPVVAGGVHPTHRAEWIMQATPLAYAVAGEGEYALPALVDALSRKRDLRSVPNLYYRDQAGNVVHNKPGPLVDMSLYDFPLAAYDLVPVGIYENLCYETSRGCYASCTFCSIPFHKCWRGKRPDRVVEDLERVASIAGGKSNRDLIYFTDDCFTADPLRARTIADQIAVARIPFALAIEARCNDLFHPGLMESLKAARTEFIQIGVECGYDSGLHRIHKGITTDRVRQVAAALKEMGLINGVMFSFIIGLPWETERDCRQTLHFAAELVTSYGGRANAAWWFPIPSTLWDQRAEFGLSLDDSFFDEGGWAIDPREFQAAHPLIDSAAVQRVEDLITSYLSCGIRVRA